MLKVKYRVEIDSGTRVKVIDMQKNGVEFSSCIVCFGEYDAVATGTVYHHLNVMISRY